MSDLALNEKSVPAIFDEVDDVRTAQRMKVQSGGEPQVITVPPKAGSEGSLRDDALALIRKPVGLTI